MYKPLLSVTAELQRSQAFGYFSDDEGNSLGVEAALSMLRFYKREFSSQLMLEFNMILLWLVLNSSHKAEKVTVIHVCIRRFTELTRFRVLKCWLKQAKSHQCCQKAVVMFQLVVSTQWLLTRSMELWRGRYWLLGVSVAAILLVNYIPHSLFFLSLRSSS